MAIIKVWDRMGDFTKAVFESKKLFEEDILKKFESCSSR